MESMTMKISDEIRRWCDDAYSGRKIRTTKDLYAIADLIDREMVELPKDADGVPIRVGDLVYLDDGRKAKVIRFIVERGMSDSLSFKIICSLDGNPDIIRFPFELWHERHERPDSLERIVEDIDEFGNEADINDAAVEFLCKIQWRIRELAKKADQQ